MQSTFFCPCSYTDTYPCGEKHETWQCGVGLADPSCPPQMFLGRLFVFSVFFYWPVSAATDWLNLARSLDGRLHRALPFASSCFSTVNEESSTSNETECAEVQATYGNATVRSVHFSAYMLVSAIGSIDMQALNTQKNDQPQWEMCQKTSERCLLDPSNTSNPAAFEDSDCLQGSVPPHYVCLSSSLPSVLYSPSRTD